MMQATTRMLLRLDPPFLFLLYFLSVFLLVMWSSCDHFCDYCSCDVNCSITSIVCDPLSKWHHCPYSLRVDFCILRYNNAIRALPHSHPLPLPSQGICSKAPDCLSGYHSHQELPKSSLDLVLRTLEPFTQCLSDNLTHVGWTSLL